MQTSEIVSWLKRSLLTALVLLLVISESMADIRLPSLICNSMVLQRDAELKLWGWASPGEGVTLKLDGSKYSTKTLADGSWEILLPPRSAGGPYVLEFSGRNRLQVEDVYFGDVWICSGQSNMVLSMERVKEKYPGEPDGDGYPLIRQFHIPSTPDLFDPRDDLPPGKWSHAIPGEALSFSATAYFFAREIHSKYGVPIGLVNASVGGTPIEAWISEDGLQSFPDVMKILEKNKDEAYVDSMVAIQPPHPSADPSADRGLSGGIPWYSPEYEPEEWQRINVPGYWEDQGIRDLDGVLWYRREIEVPKSMTGVPARLFMGRIVDADEVWVNGTRIGHTTYQYPPRRYDVPDDLLMTGKNLVVIRVMNYRGKGGFVPDKLYVLEAGGQSLDLKGDWQFRVGDVFSPGSFPEKTFQLQKQPAALYNGMISPLTRMAAKGFLWYQGESNTGDPAPYGDYLKALIRDWRALWGQGELPFLYVQLANYMDVDYMPSESRWAELREAQRSALSEPGTAMAVAIDLGEWNDIHPLNKEDVGKRLALGARHLSYGEKDLVYSGPLYRSNSVRGNRVLLQFDHCGSGLEVRHENEVLGFELAGENKVFHRAQALIRENAVEVWHDRIGEPRFVRYAWADNPVKARLYNREGLPASPFQARILSWMEVFRQRQDSIRRLSATDHRLMMEQLGISEIRPGPSGNPDAPNAANTDESKVLPYHLPDPLLFDDGTQVSTSEQWGQRRMEILEDFDREVYGRVPEHIPSVHWEVVAERDTLEGTIPVSVKELVGHVDNSEYPTLAADISLRVVIPARAEGPVPIIMEFGFIFPPGWRSRMPAPDGPTWQEQLLSKGWAYAILVPTSFQADNGAGLKEGIIGLVNRGNPRRPDNWGTLRAWAWGASRVLDYFEGDPDVDASRVGIEGLSRYGKAALVAMAYEPRFAIGFIGSSGAGGAKILRRQFGEQVENLASSAEYHWFAGNFIKYAGPLTPGDLPVDAHQLVGLCAPRPLFISVGSPQVEGQWVDARGMFLAGVHAGPVYTLLERQDLGSTEQPPIGVLLGDGELVWRQHEGGHTTGPNWPYFIRFAERYFK